MLCFREFLRILRNALKKTKRKRRTGGTDRWTDGYRESNRQGESVAKTPTSKKPAEVQVRVPVVCVLIYNSNQILKRPCAKPCRIFDARKENEEGVEEVVMVAGGSVLLESAGTTDLCVDCGQDFQQGNKMGEGVRCMQCNHCWHCYCIGDAETPEGWGFSSEPWECDLCDNGKRLWWCCCITRTSTCGRTRPVLGIGKRLA